MPKIVIFFKCVCTDIFAGRVLLHPILLTAAFLVARSGAFWLINNAIFGLGYDWGFLGHGFFLMFYHFIINAYFLVFCSYMLFRASFARWLKFIWLVLAIFILIGCIYGYFDAHINRQKEGVFAGFFIASLIAICAYVLVITIELKSFLPIAYTVVYLISFSASIWLVFNTQGNYTAMVLNILCPLAWTFYFKYKFKGALAKNAENESKI